jgi:3-mercaptopyruvate sulfurtransferase SseA
MTTIEQSRMDTLVTTDWLSQHLDDPDLVVLDCTVCMCHSGPGVICRCSALERKSLYPERFV